MEMSSSEAALHADTQGCSTSFEWRDFNRFSDNECLSFNTQTDGNVNLAISEMPTRPSGTIMLDLGTEESELQAYDIKESAWVSLWKSNDNLALTTGSDRLMSQFWLCLRSEREVLC